MNVHVLRLLSNRQKELSLPVIVARACSVLNSRWQILHVIMLPGQWLLVVLKLGYCDHIWRSTMTNVGSTSTADRTRYFQEGQWSVQAPLPRRRVQQERRKQIVANSVSAGSAEKSKTNKLE